MDFDWVHLDLSIAYNDSEIFHLLLVELAFLGFKKKVIVLEFLQDIANFLLDRKSTRLNSSHGGISRMPSSA